MMDTHRLRGEQGRLAQHLIIWHPWPRKQRVELVLYALTAPRQNLVEKPKLLCYQTYHIRLFACNRRFAGHNQRANHMSDFHSIVRVLGNGENPSEASTH